MSMRLISGSRDAKPGRFRRPWFRAEEAGSLPGGATGQNR